MTTINNVFLGNVQAERLYLGESLVWSKVPPKQKFIVNGDFTNDLTGWNTSGHWQWVTGSAYHPLSTQYKLLTQGLNTEERVHVVIDIEIISGSLNFSLYSDKYLFGANDYGVGRHIIDFTVRSQPNATLYFGRTPYRSLEMYVHSVSVVKAD